MADLVADMLKCVWLLELCMCLGRSYLRRSLLPAEQGGGCHDQLQISWQWLNIFECSQECYNGELTTFVTMCVRFIGNEMRMLGGRFSCRHVGNHRVNLAAASRTRMGAMLNCKFPGNS